MSKLYVPLLMLFILFAQVKVTHAQSADAYFGVGTASDSSAGTVPDAFTGDPDTAPRIAGAFAHFGAGFMFRPTLGVGFNYSAKFSQGSYAGLNYRPKFYSFDAIWMPLGNGLKAVPEFQGGIGGASVSFYIPPQCLTGVVCTSSTFLQSSNHFQMHLGAGLRVYVKGNIFVRPQLDVHYVNNYYQFGSGWVPEYSVAVGYSFGRH